jgi:hypothetical protein
MVVHFILVSEEYLQQSASLTQYKNISTSILRHADEQAGIQGGCTGNPKIVWQDILVR